MQFHGSKEVVLTNNFMVVIEQLHDRKQVKIHGRNNQFKGSKQVIER